MKDFLKTFPSIIGDAIYTTWLISLGWAVMAYVHSIHPVAGGDGSGLVYVAVIFVFSLSRWALRRWTHGWLASKINNLAAWALIEIPAMILIAGAGYAIGNAYLGIPWTIPDTRLETQESIAFLLFITLTVKWIIDAVEPGIQRPDDIKQVA